LSGLTALRTRWVVKRQLDAQFIALGTRTAYVVEGWIFPVTIASTSLGAICCQTVVSAGLVSSVGRLANLTGREKMSRAIGIDGVMLDVSVLATFIVRLAFAALALRDGIIVLAIKASVKSHVMRRR
jgi:hypothetical protein